MGMRIRDRLHPITVEPNPARVVVAAGGRVLVDTTNGLVLHEQGHPPVHYLPREDADMSALTRSEHRTHCPFKGEASYFSINGLEGGENAVWTYESPRASVAAIKDRLAFYPDRVSIEEHPT